MVERGFKISSLKEGLVIFVYGEKLVLKRVICICMLFSYKRNLFYRVEVKKRFSSMSLSSMGMYPGAMVTRGKDWNYGDQDGKPYLMSTN